MQQFEQGKGSYNELILDAYTWSQNLPHTITAVFYPFYAAEGQKQHARDVHKDFLRHYRLTINGCAAVGVRSKGSKAAIQAGGSERGVNKATLK